MPRCSITKGNIMLAGPRQGFAPLPAWIRVMAWRSAVLGVFGAALLAVRVHIMGGHLPVFTHFDNPAAHAESPARQLTHNYLLAYNVWLLLYPRSLACDWTMASIPLVKSVGDVRNLATLALYIGLAVLVIKCLLTRSRALAMACGLLVIPFLPASNLFFPVGFVIAERVLYIPSFGYCVLVALGFTKFSSHVTQFVHHKCRPVLVAGLLLLVVSHSARLVRRNQDWQTELSLYQSGLEVNPNNAKLYNNIGHLYEAQDKFGEALQYFLKAVTMQPDDLGAYLNIGRTYMQLKELSLAEEYLRKAKNLLPTPKRTDGEFGANRVAPSHLNVFINLGNLIARNRSRLAEAEQLYRQAIDMRADYVDAYINRGEVLMRLNRTREAERVYLNALRHEKRNADLYHNVSCRHGSESESGEFIKLEGLRVAGRE